MQYVSKLLPSVPAHIAEISGKLKTEHRLRERSIDLVYPGSGWDFKSFWAVSDPYRAFLVDPAAVTLFTPPIEGITKWRTQLDDQCTSSAQASIIQFAYDAGAGGVRLVGDDEIRNLSAADCSDEGSLRIGFSRIILVRGSERILTFIAARFEDLKGLSALAVPENLQAYAALPSAWPIVYEHKSMVSVPVMEQAIMPGGCLIWGLPEQAPDVQWLPV